MRAVRFPEPRFAPRDAAPTHAGLGRSPGTAWVTFDTDGRRCGRLPRVQQLSSQDASFLYSETPTAPMSGGALTIYDPSTAPGGKVTFTGLMAHIEQRLHTAAAFRQRLVTVPFNADHPWWVEDKT